MIIKREQFIWDFYKNGKGKICDSFDHVSYNENIFSNNSRLSRQILPRVVYVSLFPGYLNASLFKSENYKLKKIKHNGFSGAGIRLDGYDSADSYLKILKKNDLRKIIKKKRARLYKDYSVKLEHNFGSITEEKCSYLLKTLHEMISVRFVDKLEEHSFLSDWDSNIKNMVSLINNKKTSLFVVYADEKPISIQVNRHIYGVLLFCETHSFDMNYRKYGMGNFNYYLNIDWAAKNNITFMDFGNGISYIKKKWANMFYDTHYLIFRKKNNFIALIISYFEIIKIKLKTLIKYCRFYFNKL
ncbi:GNAT family N-acetyltransferase [uncultured Algibacter sp.]|uniref:GNAT family N-acetyltransferase n=1 Tax=uncultured Algibacter sp. TaxID=298659 RepID=UPI00262E5978|nr:GNAT family N-acetyltransferase [uncultured Algibacter sp.]